MTFKSVFAFSVLFLFTHDCDAKPCWARCKLWPVGKGFAAEFRSKAFEKGVRMIYLQLKIRNDSYEPLQAPNKFLPHRWVWAPAISEHLLSLSYDYDILSLGLLKRQVRHMDVKLEDEPSGCLTDLNSSCQDIVVARTLLGNVTARNGSGGIHPSKDVVCVAEIDEKINFFDSFFARDVEFRCCKVVDNQGGLNLIPECDLRVQKSNWYKDFYVVLNVLTLFVGLYSPAILFMLPDYIFDLRKECEKEHQQEEKERLKPNGYLPLPSSQETNETITEESTVVTDANDIASELMTLSRVRRPATLAEDNANVIEDPGTNESNVNEAIENEANLNDRNLNSPNSNSDISPNSSTNDKEKDDEERRKLDEFPVDDGSPVNISSLLYACASARVLRHYSAKFSFNIKLAFLWFCVIPFLVYIELALGYILKDEYLDEIRQKDEAVLTGGLFISFDFTQTANSVIWIITYFIIPLLIILILRPKDLSKKSKRVIFQVNGEKLKSKLDRHTVFIGDEVLQHFKKCKQLLLIILSLGKAPIHVFQAIQNSCDHCKKTGARRSVRLFWVLLTLISSICAVIFCVIIAAICLLLIASSSTIVVVLWSPYFMILWYFSHRLIRKCKLTCVRSIIILASVTVVGTVMLFFSRDKPLLYAFNPLVLFSSAISGPFFLLFSSSRFVIKMCGYTIIGLIYNAEIAAPIVVFFVTLAPYLRDRYFDSQTKCKKVKEIISQEWQQGIKDSLENGKLNEQEKPKKVVSDAIPKQLFWYVCDSVEYQVFPLKIDALRLLRDVAVIFFTAFLALCAIFFSTNSYQNTTVASTIAVFISAKIPMVLLRDTDNFNGWEKIKTKRIIRKSVGTFIDKKRWLKPAKEAVTVVFEFESQA